MDPGSGAGGQAYERGLRESDGFDLSRPVRSFLSTVRWVLFEPVAFFRRLPRRGRALNPVICVSVRPDLGSPSHFSPPRSIPWREMKCRTCATH
jgi:hypothetical protein